MNYDITNKKINMINGANKMEKPTPTFQEQVDTMLKKTLERSEREIPEYGDFSPVMEFSPNYDKDTNVGKYGLKIYKMPKDIVEDPKQRYIEAAVYLPAGDYKADTIVGSGNKEEILKIMKDSKFPQKLNETYGELLDQLENQ